MIEKKIYSDYVVALKRRNKERIDFLSFVRSELQNAALQAKKDALDDSGACGVLSKLKKRLEDAKAIVGASGTKDFLEKTDFEIAILMEYLPKALSEAELTVLIGETIKTSGASSIKDMGRVMKEVIAKAEGRADAKITSDLVKKRLSV
ncbi:MAG: GatB/YqeY domain-containing protein [Candidatus Omnitrophota bacterium]|nr:GatB/YqeY domain-containing protein [Candidatus Omnitrophota bacterium]